MRIAVVDLDWHNNNSLRDVINECEILDVLTYDDDTITSFYKDLEMTESSIWNFLKHGFTFNNKTKSELEIVYVIVENCQEDPDGHVGFFNNLNFYYRENKLKRLCSKEVI